MKNSFRLIACCLSLIVALLTTVSVQADDDIPPTPEPAVATEVPVLNEEPVATDVPIQESTTPDLPISPGIPEEELAITENTTADGFLTSLPEGTSVLVLNESGSPEPLVSQAAEDILLTGDPIWCPEGVAPVANVGGCTNSYTSFGSLLLYLDTHEPTQAGVIWIAREYDSGVNDASVSSFTLDGSANYSTMKNYALTLQGGWNGDGAGTIIHSDPSEFNASLNIVNWNNNVTLNDLLFTEVNSPGMNITPWGIRPSAQGAGLAITTTGDVKLNNVDAIRNRSNGVLIDNRSGSGKVSIAEGDFNGNGASIYGGLGIYVRSKNEISLNNVVANGNGWEGAIFFNDTAGGIQPNVTLTGTNSFNNNTRDGLMISSLGNIDLRNVTANGNGLTGAYIYNADGTGDVTFSGTNLFNNNVGAGMYVYSDGVITVQNVTATGNGMEGALFLNGLHGPSNKIVFVGTDNFQDNGNLDPDLYSDLYIGFDDDFVQYRDVTTHGKTVLGPMNVTQDELPGSLPESVSFLAALQVVQIGKELVISFPIPADLQDAEFYILYWDGSQWLNLETTNFEDGRMVIESGHKTENGYFQATVNFGGIFVFVQKTD